MPDDCTDFCIDQFLRNRRTLLGIGCVIFRDKHEFDFFPSIVVPLALSSSIAMRAPWPIFTITSSAAWTDEQINPVSRDVTRKLTDFIIFSFINGSGVESAGSCPTCCLICRQQLCCNPVSDNWKCASTGCSRLLRALWKSDLYLQKKFHFLQSRSSIRTAVLDTRLPVDHTKPIEFHYSILVCHQVSKIVGIPLCEDWFYIVHALD